LAWSVPEILEEVKRMEGEQKEVKSEILKLIWYMRGAVTLDEGFSMSYEDRALIGDIVKENLETTKKSGMPFF
jgi:hypothetical protein|tara:strand:- start:742 stop:960 length:219 start_codon:yes stop_codon:yes gene_type:complete